MISIKSKIQNALIGSIVIVAFCATVVLYLNQRNLIQTQQIIDTMTTEYSIISSTNNLVTTYNDVVKNPDSLEFKNKYQTISTQLRNTLTSLKATIISPDSKILLLGIENTVNRIITECDTGIAEVNDGNLQNISEHFSIALKNNEFVASNTSNLLQKELEALSITQAKSKQINQISLIVSTSILILIINILFFYSHSFAKQLISPIQKLTTSAQAIAAGDIQKTIDESLINQNDEVGLLSKSFSQMIINIKDQISKLNTSNQELNILKNTSEENNKKLQKLNEFMVGRELKMVELKQQIKTLLSQIETPKTS